MGKASASKAKGVSSTAPQLYEENISGPSFVVDVGNPTVWVNTTATATVTTTLNPTTDTAGKRTAVNEKTANDNNNDNNNGDDGAAVTSRWGHCVELSPSESVLCIIGGRPCESPTPALAAAGASADARSARTSEATSLDLLAWTAAHTGRSSKAAHVWQSVPCQPAPTKADAADLSAKRNGESAGAAVDAAAALNAGNFRDSRRDEVTAPCWPHYAPWWAVWQSRGHEGERPTAAYADGGWGAGRRLAQTRAFTPVHFNSSDASNESSSEQQQQQQQQQHSGASLQAQPSAPPPAQPATPSPVVRSHHTVTAVRGVRLRFGGETQSGTVAALELVDDTVSPDASAHDRGGPTLTPSVAAPSTTAALTQEGSVTRSAPPTRGSVASARPNSPSLLSSAAAPPPPPPMPPQLPPARAAHGACCLSQRYLCIFGGRRVTWPGDGSSSGSGGGAANTSRVPSPSGRPGGNSPGKASTAGKGAAARAVSVKKGGGNKGNDSAGAAEGVAGAAAVLTTHRDIALYDTRRAAWLPVQVTGGPGPRPRYAAAIAAVPTATTGPPAYAVVHREVLVLGGLDEAGQPCGDAWLLQILSGADGELADAAATAGALPVVTARWVRLSLPSTSNDLAKVGAISSSGPSSPPPSASALARHHAAVVVSSQRIAYVVGGCGRGEAAGFTHSFTARAVAAQPSVFTLALPHLTSTTVHLEDLTSTTDGTGAVAGAEAAGSGGAAAATPRK